MEKDYSILVGGEAGQGSRKAGLLIAKVLNRVGYKIFIYDDYQSLIRGGHNFSKIRASEKDILSHREKIDFLLALNKDTIEKHKKNLDENGVIVYNGDNSSKEKEIGIPAKEIVEKEGGIPIMQNAALVAGFGRVIGIEWETMEEVLKEEFPKKTELNLKIAKRAFNKTGDSPIKIEKLEKEPVPLLTGNEAIALGATKAGLDLYIAYPMTPATSILHYLAAYRKEFDICVCQLENEIAVITAAIGAAYTGAKTMVGTSGGGFALMTEGISLAAQSETPVLIVESQRSGPATGVPTYVEQADLLFVLESGHGDFLRFVAAPGDANEAFLLAGMLLNLSWKYQTPSILLIDKEISESTFCFDKSLVEKVKNEKPLLWDGSGEYKRYKNTKDGISPLAYPGQKNVISKATSYEHDEFGITIEEEEDVIKEMQDKKLRKFKKMREEVDNIEAVKVYGNKNSKTAIIAWGSTKGPAKEAAEKLDIKMIQPIIIQPFPEKQMKEALLGVEKIISIETNALGQMEKVLNCHGIKADERILKYTGRPFVPEEIIKEVRKLGD